MQRERGITQDTELTAQDLQTLVESYKQVRLGVGLAGLGKELQAGQAWCRICRPWWRATSRSGLV